MLGLFLGELIFRGAYYLKEFCVSKWVGLDNKTASTNSPWVCLYLGGLIVGRIFASEIWGACFREGLVLGGLLSEFCGTVESRFLEPSVSRTSR